MKINCLFILIGFLQFFIPAIGNTAGLEIAFSGIDVYHITYDFQPTDWSTLHPNQTYETTDIELHQFRRSAADNTVIETTLVSGTAGIHGAYRLADMGNDSFRYTVTEYYRIYNDTTGTWETGSIERGSITWLSSSRIINGVLQFSELYEGGAVTDISWGAAVSVPIGKSLVLKNMAVHGSGKMVVDGSASIENCTSLDLSLGGTMNGNISLKGSIFKRLQINEVGRVSISGCTFLNGSEPNIAVDSLSIQDSTFLDGSSFAAVSLCRLRGCDFLRGITLVDTRVSTLSVRDNVFATSLRLKIASSQTPITPAPDISGNSFLGNSAVTTIDLLGNIDTQLSDLTIFLFNRLKFIDI